MEYNSKSYSSAPGRPSKLGFVPLSSAKVLRAGLRQLDTASKFTIKATRIA